MATPKFSLAIPARYAASRFPAKMLADLGGKPVLRHVWEAALRVRGAEEVLVLTEAPIIRDAVESWGGTCLLTPESCTTGTERVADAIGRMGGNFIFNLQGDEPFLDVQLIERMMARTRENADFDVLTPIYPITTAATLDNPNVVKVVRRHDGCALYFSRSPIPHVRGCAVEDWADRSLHWGHLGIYLYRRPLLEELASLPPSPLARAESLEQLCFLQCGYRIQTIAATAESIAIDVPEDLIRAREFLSHRTVAEEAHP